MPEQPAQRVKIRFRSGFVIDGQIRDGDSVDQVLRVLGVSVEGWLFGQNPKVLLGFGNGAVLVDRREVECVTAFRTDGSVPDA